MDYALTPITPGLLLAIIAAAVAIWGFVKAIKEFIVSINTRHDQEVKWDSYGEKISDLNQTLIDTKADTDSKLQDIQTEQRVLSQCMLAVLEGLKQLNCNGPVTEARDSLETHLNNKAHKL